MQTRTYGLMLLGAGTLALGNSANSTARYRLFSAWFPPNHGFALTLGLELAAAKLGMLVSKALANVIAEDAGDLAWAFWVATLADFCVLLLGVASLFFVRACRRKYSVLADPSTGERLVERTGRFEPRRIAELPWTFWCIVVYHVFQTTTLLTFAQNLTEITEKRFDVSSKTAGWVSGVVIGGNFPLIPLVGGFIDKAGHRLSVMASLGLSMAMAMAIMRWDSSRVATGVSLGFVSLAICPTLLVAYDGVRSSLWHQELYGTANAVSGYFFKKLPECVDIHVPFADQSLDRLCGRPDRSGRYRHPSGPRPRRVPERDNRIPGPGDWVSPHWNSHDHRFHVHAGPRALPVVQEEEGGSGRRDSGSHKARGRQAVCREEQVQLHGLLNCLYLPPRSNSSVHLRLHPGLIWKAEDVSNFGALKKENNTNWKCSKRRPGYLFLASVYSVGL